MVSFAAVFWADKTMDIRKALLPDGNGPVSLETFHYAQDRKNKTMNEADKLNAARSAIGSPTIDMVASPTSKWALPDAIGLTTNPLLESLAPFVSTTDVDLSREDFLRTVAARILAELGV